MRERCKVVLHKAKKDELVHFDVDMSKFPDTTSFVVGLIKVMPPLTWYLCRRAKGLIMVVITA